MMQHSKQPEGFFARLEAPFYSPDETWGREVIENNMHHGYQKEYSRDQSFFSRNKGDKYPDSQNEMGELDRPQNNQSNTQAKPGTISGMLADFSRALGLGSSQNEEKAEEEFDQELKSQSKANQQSIQAQIRANEEFMHKQQGFDPQSKVDGRQMMQQQMDNEMKFVNSRYQIPHQYQSLPNQQLLHQELLEQFQKIGSAQLGDHQDSFNQQKANYQAMLEADQKLLMMQQNQQVFQKLPEHQPMSMYVQNLTPQQQQMYQQHMQLQHHAQHLKKIKRSLPANSTEQQKAQQRSAKEANLNLLSQSQAVGSGLSLQQIMNAQFLSQPGMPVQIISNPLLTPDKQSAQQRLLGTSPPILVSSGLTSQAISSVLTPLGTPQSTPVGTPRGARDGGDSSDTMSETDSQKSLRTRRKLPSIPSDQEAVSVNSKKTSRSKTKSPHEKFRSYSPLRQYTDGGYKLASSSLMLQRPSSSETNLRKITNYSDTPRPGSALGLLQGSSVVSSSGLRVEYNRDSEIASCLPPDLRHLLNSYKSTDLSYSKQRLLQSFKEHLGGDVKSSLDSRGLNRFAGMEWETDRLLQRNKELLRNSKNRFDIQRKMVYSGIGRTRKLRTHRRQLSDPKLHMETGLLKDGIDPQYGRAYYGLPHPSMQTPYKSFEYESIDDGKLPEWDTSHPYLASYAFAGGALRETAINSVLDKDHMNPDTLRYDMRRYSDSLDLRSSELNKHHKPRSWQPSPYGSDEDEDQLSREQKKAKIKAEIARRRQQIEENARLHEELLRLARLRESAELGFAPTGNTQALGGDYAMSSVLKSIDDLIGRENTADYSTPHAMPLLPDMPTRSRKLLEGLGSSPITESLLSVQHKE
ncbi:Hypothetical protein NTJ_02689 [Nesidiocoris tenuis]|uniref:Uncharacterized protein n=1 Tax=Nesidiocoris tenuis TaxID=355587 RepID=A0ABN7AF72_9HEMI|nr:Hypothetical protein NTJ_02689 [Nesidiocoris tenuis]